MAGCSTLPVDVADVDPAPSEAAAELAEAVLLSAIEIGPQNGHMQIVLSGSRPFEFMFDNDDDPLRLTIEVTQAHIQRPEEMLVERGGIQSVRLQQLPGPERIARLEVRLDDQAFYRLTKREDRLIIGVQLPEPLLAVPAPAASSAEEADRADAPQAGGTAGEAPSEPVLPEFREYQIGPGDELAINVYGEPELTRTYIVSESGDLAFQFVGAVRVAGLTTDEVAGALRRALSPTYVLNPQISVEVKKYKNQRVFVVGATSPATFTLESDTTLIEVLSQIEGLESNSHLFVYRRGRDQSKKAGAQSYGKEAIRVDLERLLRQGDMSLNFVLQPRDVIYIPTAVRKGPQLVFVVGAIRPRTFPLQEGMTLIEVLSKLNDLENRTHVLVYRRSYEDDASDDLARNPTGKPGPEEDAIRVDLERLLRQGDMRLNLVLEPRDVIYVPDASQGGVVSNSITVFGEVKRPGPIKLPENGMTIVEAIAEAGGFAPWAAPNRTRILRIENGKERTINVNVSAVMRGKLSQNIELKPDDVVVVPERRLF